MGQSFSAKAAMEHGPGHLLGAAMEHGTGLLLGAAMEPGDFLSKPPGVSPCVRIVVASGGPLRFGFLA